MILSKKQQSRPTYRTSWKLWIAIASIVPGSLTYIGITMLLKLPAAPNCPQIFLPTATASVRLYCAELAASKQTIDDLAHAIKLTVGVPQNHPLRPEVDRLLEEWSLEILRIAEKKFQNGKLNEAVSAARIIPKNSPASKLALSKINRWELTWKLAGKIYQKAIRHIQKLEWHSAHDEAVELTKLNNNYWADIKYNQLVDILQATQKENDQLDKGFSLLSTGDANNILKAIELAQVSLTSQITNKSEDLLNRSGQALVDIAKEKLYKGDWKTAELIAKKLPLSLNLEAQAQDLIELAESVARSNKGTIPHLEQAIFLAQQLPSNRPLYSQASRLIHRWQLEISDIQHLEKAHSLASFGTIEDLEAAIAEANKIHFNNPRYTLARKQVQEWVEQIQIIEDTPIIEEADTLAASEEIEDLYAAIAHVSQIIKGRALYREARNRVEQWTELVEILEARPILNNAELRS